ncbi:MAG: 5-carboxymethyl-2-hydroxymuconate Delta-isomerase [Pseudomonadota bacterium]
MPHLILDHSQNLAIQTDLQALCDRVRDAALETGLFELGALRVRAHAAGAFTVADGLADNAYLHLTVAIGAGRSADQKRRAGDHVWAALTDQLAPLLAGAHFALTMEWREIDPELSWKQNAIHPRIRAEKESQP